MTAEVRMAPHYDFTDPQAVSFCPSCGSAFRVPSGSCEECRAPLIGRGEAMAEWRRMPPPDTDERSVFLRAAPNLVEAELIRATLGDAGIGFSTEDITGVWGPLPTPEGQIRFFVEERDLKRALDALAEVPSTDDSGGGATSPASS